MTSDADAGPRNARWVRLPGFGQNYPALEFEYRGHTVTHPWDGTKRTWFSLGFVFLGAEWERRLPPVRCTYDGRIYTLRGFTTDAAVHQLVGRFFRALDARTWRPGPAA